MVDSVSEETESKEHERLGDDNFSTKHLAVSMSDVFEALDVDFIGPLNKKWKAPKFTKWRHKAVFTLSVTSLWLTAWVNIKCTEENHFSPTSHRYFLLSRLLEDIHSMIRYGLPPLVFRY